MIFTKLSIHFYFSTYMQTVRCTSNTTCFVLDTKNFERLVSKKNNPQTMDVMREYVKSKLHTRMNMRNADLIPLLGYLHQNLTEQLLPPTKKVSFMYSLWLILQTKKLSIGGPYLIEIVYWLLRAVNMTMRKPCSPPHPKYRYFISNNERRYV